MSFWNQWTRLTRHLEGSILALGREENLWNGLEVFDPGSIVISDGSRGRNYKISLENHLAAVTDREVLYASVLIHSYAACEAAACEILGIDSRDASGVESWAGKLLEANGRNWGHLDDFEDARGHVKQFGGKAFLVEAAVARNCCAHGSMILDEGSVRRLEDSGNTAYSVGEEMELDYDRVYEYRNILRSVMRMSRVDPDYRASRGEG